MPRYVTALTLTAIALTLAATARAEPLPDPPPGAKSWTWDTATYTYDTTSINGLWRYRCYVPFVGPRKCYRIGMTAAGVRFALK